MENGNFLQSGKRQAQRIDFRQEKGAVGQEAGAGPAHTGGKCAKIHCAEKVFPFFSVSLPSNKGKGKKNFHLAVGCCFLLLRGLCVRGRGSKSVLKCKEMFVCALQLLLSCLETA